MANFFVGNEKLKERGYKAYIPRHVVCVTGVLAGIPADISVDEIKADMECKYPVVDVYRLNRFVDGSPRPTNRVSVTFRTKQLLEKVKIFCCWNQVRPFVQKVLFCKNCHRCIHKTENCKSKLRCSNCTEIHDETDVNYKNCTKQLKCWYCKTTSHGTTDETCPEREKQRNKKALMARQNLTFVEAQELVTPILSSNIYEALVEVSDNPTPAESFAKMTAGNFIRMSTGTVPKRRVETTPTSTNDEHRNPRRMEAGKIQEGREKNMEKRSRMEKDRRTKILNQEVKNDSKPTEIFTGVGTGLNNTFKTTDRERWKNMALEAKQAAETSMRGTLMNFYTDLVQKNLPTEWQEIIKEVSKQHFKLNSTIF
ncbi:uncharacterized protein LOC131679584 [Topomyia yanbarensis]|uniref:uncharacterized protein LOC131679584 n=1 Tax=Topomyia yanbarensis TaxID=2498891 RepID=UPI00273ACBB4|nr:uncharacterized protein LOC131679584 [Topomyia yanbarensis]